MRLWTVHPRYLDGRGLAALWREALLAQAVLRGRTTGYRHHPQLERFRAQPDPVAAMATYLDGVLEEAERRGYHFEASRIAAGRVGVPIAETEGQLQYEWNHLMRKLAERQSALYRLWTEIERPEPHPLFRIIPGPVQPWEKTV
jgi:hypothetical protein